MNQTNENHETNADAKLLLAADTINMEELTIENILNSQLGFEYRNPLLIKKYNDYRLSIFQTKQKTSWGWSINEFKVEKLKPHAECESLGIINYMHELERIVGDCG